VASLADTNILVYCFDHRYPAKLAVAREWMERGMVDGSVKTAHESILEFVVNSSQGSFGRGAKEIPCSHCPNPPEG
jgi:hypothetical protein